MITRYFYSPDGHEEKEVSREEWLEMMRRAWPDAPSIPPGYWEAGGESGRVEHQIAESLPPAARVR